MTITSAINGQSVGTGGNIGSGLFATKLTRQATSTRFALEVTIANGATGFIDERSTIQVNYAVSPIDLDPDVAKLQLKLAKTMVCRPSTTPGETRSYASVAEDFKGDYLYIWVDQPPFHVAGTLTVRVAELDIFSASTPMPVTGVGVAGAPSSTLVQAIQGLAYSIRKAFTRTANTTAYTALDVIGIDNAGSAGSAVHELTTIGPSGGHVIITDCHLEIDLAAVPASMSTFRLHLFDAAPAALLDNAAFDLGSTAGDRAKYLGAIEIVTPVDRGSTLWSENVGVNKKVKLATGSTSLFAVLQTDGGYTPTSGEAYAIRLETLAA